MSVGIVSTTSEVQNFLDYLAEKEIGLLINDLSVANERITWQPFPHAGRFLLNRKPTIADYRYWLVNGHFSAVLFDGSLLQITYDFLGNTVTGHRLAYIPSPFVMDQDLLFSEALEDVVDYYLSEDPADILLNTPVHFDYDPKSSSTSHPSSHMTFNSPDLRLPCVEPLRLGRFVEFVFREFYPSLWNSHEYFSDMPKSSPIGGRTTNWPKQRIHVAWAA